MTGPTFRGDPARIAAAELRELRRLSSQIPSIKIESNHGDPSNLSQTRIRVKAHKRLEAYESICISAPIFSLGPRDRNLSWTLKNTPAFATQDYDSQRPWVVISQPLATGKIGWAVMSGITPCYVNVSASGNAIACQLGASGFLEPCDGGIARILWIKPGTGKQPALIELCPSPPRFIVGQTHDYIAPASTGMIGAIGLTYGVRVRHLGTQGIAAQSQVGATWEDLRKEYIITMEFC